MREVDRVATETFHIPLEMMMENAGRALALLAMREGGGGSVLILAGRGNNGGGGLAAARHLHNRGVKVEVALLEGKASYAGVPAKQLRIVEATRVRTAPAKRGPSLQDHDLLIDAMVGYGLKDDLRGTAAEMARAANESGVPILALDVPSGLNGDTGVPGSPCVSAARTLTLALPKAGLLEPQAADFVGELYLGDIALPPELYRHFGVERPPFNGHAYVRL